MNKNTKYIFKIASAVLVATLLTSICLAESPNEFWSNYLSEDNNYDRYSYRYSLRGAKGDFLFLKINQTQTEQTEIAPIPDGEAYHFMQEINGKYLVRVVCWRDHDSPYYPMMGLGFGLSHTYILDTNVASPAFREILLEQYDSRLVLLNNDHWVAKKPNGQYQLFRPDGTEIELQIEYGKKLDVPDAHDYIYEKTSLYPQATYQGMSLDYDPYSNRYIMLLGLNPYYKTDGSDRNWEITGPLYLAVFCEDGSVDKIMKIPDIRGIATAPKLNEPIPQPRPKDEWVADIVKDGILNYQFAMEFFPDKPNQVLLDHEYLIDWEKESLSKQKVEKKPPWNLPFGSKVSVRVPGFPYPAPEKSPLAVDYKTTNDIESTYLYYPQENIIAWKKAGRYLPNYLIANEDGTYSIFMIS